MSQQQRTIGNIEDMAIGGSTRSILMKFGEEHLQCSICQDFLKTPKTLACFHSFCEECLLQYQKSPRRSILCPLCRKETSSPKGGVRKLVTDFKLACMIDEVVQARETQMAPTCRSHVGKKCVVFCETCCQLVCLSCLTDSDLHRKHEVGEVGQDTDVVGKRQLMKDYQSKLKRDLAENVAALEAAGVWREDLVKTTEKIRQEVEDKANEETAKIAADKKCILDEIQQFERKRGSVLNEYAEELKSRSVTLQQMIHQSTTAQHSSNDYDFLRGFSKVKSGLRFLAAHPHPNVDEDVAAVEYPGSLLRPAEWKLLAESSHSSSCCGRGVTARRGGGILVADLWNRNIVAVSSSQSLSTIKTMKTHPRDVAMTGHHLVVVDDTAFVKMFPLTDGGKYFQFPTTTSKVREDRVDLRSVATNGNGLIVVGDAKRNVLTEHQPRNGAIVREVQLETPPEFLAINSVSYALVSGEYSGKVQGVNLGKVVVTITPTIRGSKVRCCTGVSWGKDGFIYIAMHNKATGTGHVHTYDASGQFVKCIVQGLYLPQGIQLADDDQKIVVADYDTIKVYAKENL